MAKSWPPLSEQTQNLFAPPIWEYKQKSLKYLNKNKKIFDLNQAVPNYPPPPEIKSALSEYLNDSSYSFYTPDEGLPELREVIVKELSRLYQFPPQSQEICVTAGANNAFYSLLATIAQAGDEIIMLTPYYFNYFMSAQILGLKIVQVDSHFSPKLPLTAIEQAINTRTKALVLVNPSNPSGQNYAQSEVTGLFNLCKQHGILLISDEVYNYFHDDYPQPPSVLNCSGGLDAAVSIHSYSKTFSLTGFRVGFVVANEKILQHFIKVQDSNIICAPRLGQIAALAGLKNSLAWVEERAKELQLRRQLFKRKFNEKKCQFEVLACGAFFLYLRCLKKNSIEQTCMEMISQNNIIMLPASCFGKNQTQMIRVALGNLTLDDIPYVVERFHEF